jgi:DNA-binding transcriptional LysR family regulator
MANAETPRADAGAPLDLAALRLALRVSDLGSVAAAAREADWLPATATAAIRRLESQLDATLFARTTRALKVTPEGEQFLERAREALALLDQGAAELHAPMTQIRGRIRLTVSNDLGSQVVRPMVDDFLQRHPQVQVELQVADRVSDIGREPVDAALRYGVPARADQIVRPLAENTAILVAAPSYLKRAGTPTTLAELDQHEGIALRISGRPGHVWSLLYKGRPVEIRPRVRRTADNGLVSRLWAIDGHGIALKSRMDVADDLLAGRLVRLLPGLESQPYPLVMVLARGSHLSARIRALADALRPQLQARVAGVSDAALKRLGAKRSR